MRTFGTGRLGAGCMAMCSLLCVGVCVARADEPPATPCTGSVDGHVVDDATHEPVDGATVRVNGVDVTATDDTGRFVLTGQCAGDLTIEVERDDYQTGARTLTVDGSVSLELPLHAIEGEVIEIEQKALEPVNMRSTAVVTGEALERTRGQSFSEALADVPGVTQLRAGSGLAKPIVRGQYGRRLLLTVDGVRHRAQEWGMDHAPEIDPFIADKVTVVRGASGVRFGPDAIGGVVVVDPPDLPHRPGLRGEAHLVGFSNGEGGSFASRLQGATAVLPGAAFQLEGSLKRLKAPATPDYALDNTGQSEWNLGGTVGYRAGDSDYKLSYRHYQAELGVCTCFRVESSEDFYAQLARDRPLGSELYTSEYEIERPYQDVSHDLAVARGRWRPESLGTITATYAFQYDHRREFDIVREATTGPQFAFRLWTHDLDVSLEHIPIHLSDHLHLRGWVGAVAMAQVHAYSGLPLVPDHQAGAGGVYVTERLAGHDFELEAGVRYDYLARAASIERIDFLRLVRSGQLDEDACGELGDADSIECDSRYHTVSASLGGMRQLTPEWSVKLDLSTASRPPNPDEQYINGTSPTFPVLGLGKPDLGSETTYSGSVTSSYRSERVAAEVSAYGNYISDYVYFAPAIDENGNPIFDVLIRGAFPRFVTRPVDAVFYGADGGVSFRPLPSLDLGAQASIVRARNLSDDGYLVFVPPDRLRGSVTYTRTGFLGSDRALASVDATYVRRQDRFDLAADLAPPPDAYVLFDAELGVDSHIGDQTVKVALQGTNLLDTRYREYTSLLRYFVDQPGRQVMLRLSIHFSTSPGSP